MDNPLDKVLGNGLGTNEANSSRTTFSNTMTETSKLAEWKKNIFRVTKDYDDLICEAVEKGYEFYDVLPEDMQFELVMEIIKTERLDAFCEFGDISLLTDYLIEIMLKKGNSKSFTELYDYLQAHFIKGLGKKPACFANKITGDLQKQIEINAEYDNDIGKYGDPDDWKYDIETRDSYLSPKEEASHG